ncbi:MAG: transporter substrate-binding domain-containing protein [Pseudodesulfovibrio sp.]
MKGYRTGVFVVAALLVFAGGAGAAAQWTDEHPLIVVHSAQTPPMSFIGFDGEKKGLIVDYWRLWSRVNRVPVKLVLVDWPESLRMVLAGEADVHGGLFLSGERKRFLDFAPPYFELDAALVVRADLNIRSLAGLGDHAVGVLDHGYSASFVQARFPGLKRREYPTAAALISGAVAGEVDAMILERVTLVHLLGEMGKLGDFRMLDVLYTRSVHPAVAKGNAAVLELVERGMRAIPAKELERAFRRWTIPNGSGPSWLIALLGMGIAIAAGLLGFLLFQGRMRG